MISIGTGPNHGKSKLMRLFHASNAHYRNVHAPTRYPNVRSDKPHRFPKRRAKLYAFSFFCVIILIMHTVNQKPCVKFTIGTVIRGDEWDAETIPSNQAVLSSLKSFIRSAGSKRVIIFVDKQESCAQRPRYLNKCTCVSLKVCVDPVFQVPTMDCILKLLVSMSRTEIVSFINGDIIIFDSFARSVALAAALEDEFVMVGRRHTGTGPLVVEDLVDWRIAELHSETLPIEHGYAVDYFVFRKSASAKQVITFFPPFVVGAWRWDNVFLSSIYKYTNATVMDATFSAPILHQLSHAKKDHASRRGATYNDRLAKRYSGVDYYFGTVDFADIIIKPGSNIGDGDIIKDPWHVLARQMFRDGLLTVDLLLQFATHSEKRIEEYNQGQVEISVDDHLRLLENYRKGFISNGFSSI